MKAAATAFHGMMQSIAARLGKAIVHKYPKGEYHEPVRSVRFEFSGEIDPKSVLFEYRKDGNLTTEERVCASSGYKQQFVVYAPFHVEKREDGSFVARKV